jgi:hypothetical protein
MADVLLMSALKLGNPIQIFIQVKVNNFAHRPDYSCLRRFHGDAPVVWIEHDRYRVPRTSGVRGSKSESIH